MNKMVTKKDFDRLEADEIIGSTVKELRESWEKHGCPRSGYEQSTTTEMSDLEPGYWIDFESQDEPYADYHNSLIDQLLDLVDVRNISDAKNPIFYVNVYRDEGFSEYEEEALSIIQNDSEYIYQKVCGVDEQKLKDMGYEFPEESED